MSFTRLYDCQAAAGQRLALTCTVILWTFPLVTAPPAALAQLPPGGKVIQISQPFTQEDCRLNDKRLVVFRSAVPALGIADILMYDYALESITTVFSDGKHNNSSPDINNLGAIVFHSGIFNQNYEILLCGSESDSCEELTSASYPETNAYINDSFNLTWQSTLCWPTYDCIEHMILNDSELFQITFSGEIEINQDASLGILTQIAWHANDRSFQTIFNVPDHLYYYDGIEYFVLNTSERALTFPHCNDLGHVAWSWALPGPCGPGWVWDPKSQSVTQAIPYGFISDINNRMDILFNAQVGWMLRSGVFYQPFEADPYTSGVDMNNNGDVVGSAPPGFPTPDDIFLMVIDPIVGDYDEDGDLDLSDAAGLSLCMSGPDASALSPCSRLDFDADSDLDLLDAAAFMNSFVGDCAIGITTPPNGEGVCVGGSVTLSIDTVGAPVASWQWRFDNQNIEGATDPTYTITSAQESHEGLYGVILTSPCGWEVKSDRRHLITVHSHKPVISMQPASQTVCLGQDVRFVVSITGTDDKITDFVTYQWRHDGVPIPDADQNFLVLRDVDESDEGGYRVRVTNACGQTLSSSATLTIAPPIDVPDIIGQPLPLATPAMGQAMWIQVTANCANQYQWFKEGLPIGGATTARYDIPVVTCETAGTYSVRVSNANGAVMSDNAVVQVTGCP